VLLVPLCPAIEEFQRSSSSRTCRNEHDDYDDYDDVSMLFNEPKLLKCSAVRPPAPPRMLFQCSSASRKFLNLTEKRADERHRLRFSALQRAENSSISVWYEPSDRRYKVSVLFSEPKIPQSASKDYAFVLKKAFQCSSASRKFLNRGRSGAGRSSVLVSVLFSEPKIPQCQRANDRQQFERLVSVLFSEPKIPQSYPPQVS